MRNGSGLNLLRRFIALPVIAFLHLRQTAIYLMIAGVLLFGFGICNATALPPLVAQAEFDKTDVSRVVPLTVAISQAVYASHRGLRSSSQCLGHHIIPGGAGASAFAAVAFMYGRLLTKTSTASRMS